MSQNQPNTNQTVDNLVDEGRELMRKANQRHVVVRRPDGTTLVDVNMTTVAIIVVAIFFLQPIGTFAVIGAIAYGIYNKLKIEVTHELQGDDNVVDVNISQDD